MNEQNTTLMESVPAARELWNVPGFDPRKFLRRTGETALKLDLPYKRLWFRLACPEGRILLAPLRITDQMAIFEARLYTGKDDATLLSSFTSTQMAKDGPGGRYIRAAQDEALNEALDNAGFGIQLCDVAPKAGGSGVGTALPQEQPDTPVEEAAPVSLDTVQEEPPASAQTGADTAPSEQNAAHQVVSNVISMPVQEPPPASEPAPMAEASTPQSVDEAPVADEAVQEPPRYTADMTIMEIRKHMTLDEAKQIVVPVGSCKGLTLGQVAEERKSSLKWYLYAKTDNIVKAGATMLLEELGLIKAG